jgi:hypothetical protein
MLAKCEEDHSVYSVGSACDTDRASRARAPGGGRAAQRHHAGGRPVGSKSIVISRSAILPALGPIMTSILAVLAGPLRHLPTVLGTRTRNPEGHSYKPTNDPSGYASHGHTPCLVGDARFLARGHARCFCPALTIVS